MQILLLIFIILASAYIGLILLYRYGWEQQPEFVEPDNFVPQTSISIIIPARNEAPNIAACIDSILANDYPSELVEIIVIDDHSTDNTADIVRRYNDRNVHCLQLADYLDEVDRIVAYKKKALETGIARSSGELIITTDADCIAPVNWLRNIAAMYQDKKPAMIVGPVDFSSEGSVLQVFQSLDFMSMQGITAAAHRLKLGNMSNGANLAFTRAAFNAVGGYRDISHMASGDDYLLMVKMKKMYPSGINYLKSREAIISTTPQKSWGAFLQQRIRWSSKSGKYGDIKLTLILLLVYLYNLALLSFAIAGIKYHHLLPVVAVVLLSKTLAELVYLYPVATFFGKRQQLSVFPLLQPLHIIYVVIAGFLGFAGKYSWKDRTVK